jgi:hypoxanthine phosphoribosyltransferase
VSSRGQYRPPAGGATVSGLFPIDHLEDPRIGDVYLSRHELAARVAELGAQVAADYADREFVLVSVLRGAFVFVADLSRAIPLPHSLEFVALAAYGGRLGGRSTIRLIKDLDAPIQGRNVLIVEDVVDTGLTLNYLIKNFRLRGPTDVAVCTLLDRPYRRLVDDLPIRYVGFTVPDEFFVGYGFDLDQRYRGLPDLRVVDLPDTAA